MKQATFLVTALLLLGQPVRAGWTLYNAEVNDGNALVDVSMGDELTACAVGAIKNPSSGNSEGRIMCTQNGGQSWSKTKPEGTLNIPIAVHLVNGQVGYLATLGFKSKLYRTDDGGRSWKEQTLPSGVSAVFSSLFFLNENTGWAAGGGVVLYTTDGGSNWRQASVPALGDRVINSVYFVDSNTGFAVGGYPGDEQVDPPVLAGDGFILKSTDGGASWQMVREGLDGALYRVVFAGAQKGWAGGGGERGLLLHTADGGSTWNEQTIPAGQYGAADFITGLSFPDEQHGWATGNIGQGNPMVLRTSDGGNTWTIDQDYVHAFDGLSGFQAFAKYSMVLDVHFLYPEYGLVVGKNMIIVGFQGTSFCPDVDQDGHRDKKCGGDDCDDQNPAVSPSAEELCNGLDENCNNQIDESFDLQRDPQNCGECGFNCQPAQVCWGGKCVSDCPGDLTRCGQECADLKSDLKHCGSCENACAAPHADFACQNGSCVLTACHSGYYDIDGSLDNGCEYACAPSGAEVCDGLDNDCDGKVDEDLSGCQTPDGGRPDGEDGSADGGTGGETDTPGEGSGCGCGTTAAGCQAGALLLLLALITRKNPFRR